MHTALARFKGILGCRISCISFCLAVLVSLPAFTPLILLISDNPIFKMRPHRVTGCNLFVDDFMEFNQIPYYILILMDLSLVYC